MRYRKKNEVEAIKWDEKEETIKMLESWGVFVIKHSDGNISLIGPENFICLRQNEEPCYIVKQFNSVIKYTAEYFEVVYEKIK
jgi:hypothetical protein